MTEKQLEKQREREERAARKLEAEIRRTKGLMVYEERYGAQDLVIAGIDEVGRGPLAGPVLACAAILPRDSLILELNDSKKLSEKKRERLFDVLQKEAVAFAFGASSPKRIDEINILQATYEAMREAIAGLSVRPDILFNDAVTIPDVELPQIPIIGGDGKSVSIAAASILAKVTRDRVMMRYAGQYPQYGFEVHKGYGTKRHYEALRQFGPCPIHRQSFLKKFYENG